RIGPMRRGHSRRTIGARLMNNPIDWLEKATIKFDGMVREPASGPTDLYKIQTDHKSLWFEAEYKYAENGNDFWLTMRNFGLGNKAAAGSRSSVLLPPFTVAEAAAAKARLEGFFLGPRDNPGLPNSIRNGRGRCLGLNFPDGWIRVLSQESAN